MGNIPVVCVCVFKKKKSAPLLPAAFTFSFGQVSRTGDEGTDGAPSSTTDIQVPVEITIDPPSAFLSADTIVMVSVSGGSATGRVMDSNIAITFRKYCMSNGHCCIEPGTVYLYCYLISLTLQRVKILICLEVK